MTAIGKHSNEWIAERIDEIDKDSRPIPLINLPKSSCGALIFHTTTKENMKNVMRHSIKNVMRHSIKNVMRHSIKNEMRYGIKTDKLSGHIKDNDIKTGNSIAIACVPQEKIYLRYSDRARFYNKDEPFLEWDARRMEWEERGDELSCLHKPLFLGHREDMILKEIISPESIIGCIDIVKTKNTLKYKINKNCKY